MGERAGAAPSGHAPDVSVIVPVYGDGAALEALLARAEATLDRTACSWELLFVNDGSPRECWRLIERLARASHHVRGFNLRRNFGQHNALLAGIRASRGGIVVTMDDDLQHPPEEIPALLRALEAGADVAYGTPLSDPHGLWRRTASVLLKAALASVLGARMGREISAFRAFRGDLRRIFVEYRSPYVSVDVLLSWATSQVTAVRVRHDPREHGRSRYTFWRLLGHALDMVTGFSVWPLRLASVTGFAFTCFGGVVLVYVIGRYLMAGGSVPGFPFLASVVALFAGAQLFALGIIGEYLARMYFRMMDRPPYVIESTTSDGPGEGA